VEGFKIIANKHNWGKKAEEDLKRNVDKESKSYVFPGQKNL